MEQFIWLCRSAETVNAFKQRLDKFWSHQDVLYSGNHKADLHVSMAYKNSSGDEIANVNFLRRYGTYVLQNTKKENLLRLTN